MRWLSGPAAARAKHAAGAIVRRPLPAIAILAIALMLVSATPAEAGEAERELPGGRFFTQTGDGETTGFAVVDDADGSFWTFFQASGGVAQLGYPISTRWQDGPFIYQAFQKAIFQQRPSGGIAFVNIYDRLSALGHDAWLSTAKLVPRPWEFAEDEDQPFAVVQRNHLALLDLNPEIKAAWYTNPNWLNAFGLPVAYEDRGDVRVLRAQRAVFQQWMITTTFAPLGGVVIANGGDHFKSGGQIPTAATVPERLPDGQESTPAASQGQTDFFGQTCRSTSNPNPVFTAPVTDLSQINVITPPGSSAGGVIKAHSYFRPESSAAGANGGLGIPVYAPADSSLVSVGYYVQDGVNEYLLFFEVSCEVIYKLDHVRSVVDEIRAVAPPSPRVDSRSEWLNPPVSFSAGELVGYTWAASWDFGVYNSVHRNQFVNQARYDTGYEDQELHAACPYDYYSDPLRLAHYALFGTSSQVRVSVDSCRGASRDVAGTVAGAWFRADRPGVNPGFAVATALSGRVMLTGPGIYLFIDPGMATYADPARITTAHCYLSGGSWVFMQRLVDGRLAVASGGGSCPGALPAVYQTFVR